MCRRRLRENGRTGPGEPREWSRRGKRRPKEGDQFPTYDVRLDAGIDGYSERRFRLFVRIAVELPAEQAPDAALDLVQMAKDQGVSVSFENNGIALV